MIKVLNLYAGLGGNRKLWTDVDVTSIENNKKIAKIYKKYFPNDKIIVTDAHRFLLEHYNEYQFIWSSPPCPSHSLFRKNMWEKQQMVKFPDMRLYQEIIFLKSYFKGLWVVENVRSFYEPLIRPYVSGNHFFWSNFHISNIDTESKDICYGKIKDMEKRTGFDLNGVDLGIRKDQAYNNCVQSDLALYIFNMAFKTKQQTLKVFENGIRE